MSQITGMLYVEFFLFSCKNIGTLNEHPFNFDLHDLSSTPLFSTYNNDLISTQLHNCSECTECSSKCSQP